jgi:hypothetical protein
MSFGTPRDIALIFLSLQALVVGVVPLALFAALAYGVYKLRGVVQKYLRLAFTYAEKAREAVEKASHKVAAPFIQAQAKWAMFRSIVNNLKLRRLT